MELETLVLGNPVILANILSHLDYSNFKTARLVSVIWNEIGRPQMKSFNLRLQFLLSDSEEFFLRIPKNLEKVQILQNYEIHHITFLNECNSPFPRHNWQFLENILTEFGPQIYSIELSFCLYFKDNNINSLLKTVLKECTSARELRMNLDSYNFYEELEESYKNTSIRKLHFSKPPPYKRGFPYFLQLFPNLEEIECDGDHTINRFIYDIYNPQNLEKLKVLKLSNRKRSSRFSATNLRMFPELVNLAQLEITDLHIDNYDTFPNNYYPLELFDNFKETLEYFTAGFILDGEMKLAIPKMNRLHILNLRFENLAGESCKVAFKAGHGLETENFPSLKKLNIGFGLKSYTEQFINNNFGSFQNGNVENITFIFPSKEDWEKFCELATQKFSMSFPKAEIKFGYYLS